jgi:FAD/FMN-containing dehydrogenase
VKSLTLRVADGRILSCSRDVEPELFRATVGGMGLTGHMLEVEFTMQRVPSPWILQESERIPNIDAFLQALDDAARVWPFTVGWIDCLARGGDMGRGLLFKGRWATAAEAGGRPFPAPLRRPSVPLEMPDFVLSRPTVQAFNEVLYRQHVPRVKRGIVHYEAFWYPLDAIGHWNKLYGRRGLTQYQCVIPRAAGARGVRAFLELLTARGGASFLAVIKDCGAQGEGLLSFPMSGTSIALDIAIRDDTQQLVDALNERVLAAGGRVYLAKDNFTRPEHYRAMEPRLPEWERIRRKWDPESKLRSAQSVRVLGDPA